MLSDGALKMLRIALGLVKQIVGGSFSPPSLKVSPYSSDQRSSELIGSISI